MPTADKEKVIAFLRERLELELALATELADRAGEIFLSETGRTQIPARAQWLWVDLALVISKEDAGEVAAPITSVKRGDTTIQYAAPEVKQQSTGTVMDRVRAWRVVRAR